MKVILVTSNASKHIVPASKYLWIKYTPWVPEFISTESNGLKEWGQTVREKVLDIQKKENIDYNDYVIFGLDDYLVIDHFQPDLFNDIVDRFMPDRYELGWGALRKKEIRTLYETKGLKVGRFSHNSPYRISCQISVWRLGLLIKFLQDGWSPWDFEVRGTEASKKLEMRIIGTMGKYALRTIEESALSQKRLKGRINILGLKHSDRDEMIKKGFFKEDELVYGINNGHPVFDIDKVGAKYYEQYKDS